MDIGNWLFIGVAVVSGIASLSKATKKRTSAQTSQQSTSMDENKSDADDWLKNNLRETTKGFLETEDEFIPKNDPKPKDVLAEKLPPPATNAEQFRRTSQSLEVAAGPHVSLEDTVEVEGNVIHTGLRGSVNALLSGVVFDQPLLDPVDDLKNIEEVRKALIYGEIMRPKF